MHPSKITARVSNNSELKGAHFRILPKKVAIFAKNVRFLYYKEANKKRHLPLKVAPMCAKAHIIRNSARLLHCTQTKPAYSTEC